MGPFQLLKVLIANFSEEISYAKSLLAAPFNRSIIELSFVLATINAILHRFAHKYLILDWEFVAWLFILVIIDTSLGAIKHWKKKTFSSSGWGRFAIKVIIYILLIYSIGILTNYKIAGKHPDIFDWIDDIFYSALMLRELVSIVENTAIIYPGIIPEWIQRRLQKLDKDGFEGK